MIKFCFMMRNDRNLAGKSLSVRRCFSLGKNLSIGVLWLKYYYTARVHETRDVTYNWVSNLPLLILAHRKACSWNRSVNGNKSPTLHHHHRLPIILLSTYRTSQYWALGIKHSGSFALFLASSFFSLALSFFPSFPFSRRNSNGGWAAIVNLGRRGRKYGLDFHNDTKSWRIVGN